MIGVEGEMRRDRGSAARALRAVDMKRERGEVLAGMKKI